MLPTVLHLHSHLSKMMKNIQFCKGLAKALLQSLRKRFAGIFRTCHMLTSEPESAHLSLPYEDEIYVIATTLDPRFSLEWLDVDVILDLDDDDRQHRIRNRIKYATQGIFLTNTLCNRRLLAFLHIVFETHFSVPVAAHCRAITKKCELQNNCANLTQASDDPVWKLDL